MPNPRSVKSGRAPARPRWGRLASIILLVIELAAVGVMLALFGAGNRYRALAMLPVIFFIAFGGILMLMWVRRRQMFWDVRLLETLLPQVRQGELPIESLSEVPGRLAGVARVCQELLRDLKQQRAEVTQLEAEMRQRVAHRTQALERTIGALRQQAVRDPLTGLYNRRALEAYLPEVIQRAKAAKTPLCVLMIDVDHFKVLNDTLGHAAGDQMLKSIGQLIRSTIRENDVAFRCGGDEFVVVLEGHDEQAGQGLANRLSSLVDALGKTFRVSRPPRLSIGVSSLATVSEPTPQALLHRADQHLYEVKASRRSPALTAATA